MLNVSLFCQRWKVMGGNKRVKEVPNINGIGDSTTMSFYMTMTQRVIKFCLINLVLIKWKFLRYFQRTRELR